MTEAQEANEDGMIDLRQSLSQLIADPDNFEDAGGQISENMLVTLSVIEANDFNPDLITHHVCTGMMLLHRYAAMETLPVVLPLIGQFEVGAGPLKILIHMVEGELVLLFASEMEDGRFKGLTIGISHEAIKEVPEG